MVESIEFLSLIIGPFLADVGKSHLEIAVSRCGAIFARIAAACTTASSGIADRLEAFDRHIVEGAGVVAEHRQAIVRRDSEVKLLRGQIDADRALTSEPSPKPGQ